MSTNKFAFDQEGLEILIGRVRQVLAIRSGVEPNKIKDRAVVSALGTGPSSLPTWRKRGTIPFSNLVTFAFEYDISLDWLFYGGPHEMVMEEDAWKAGEEPQLYKPEASKLVHGLSDEARPPAQAAATVGRMFAEMLKYLTEDDRRVVLSALWGEGVAYDILHGPYEEVRATKVESDISPRALEPKAGS